MPQDETGQATAQDVMELLGREYGPVEWERRYDPASELVYTILSQHTSDINSERAFRTLMATFGTLEAIAAADVADIEEAIRSGARLQQPHGNLRLGGGRSRRAR